MFLFCLPVVLVSCSVRTFPGLPSETAELEPVGSAGTVEIALVGSAGTVELALVGSAGTMELALVGSSETAEMALVGSAGTGSAETPGSGSVGTWKTEGLVQTPETLETAVAEQTGSLAVPAGTFFAVPALSASDR